MTFKEIYNKVIPLWRQRIDFDDGFLIEPDGFVSLKLSGQWTKIEDMVGTEEPYSELMVWTMYQVFHRHARGCFSNKIYHLNPVDFGKEEIEEVYYKNLQEGSWEEEFRNYSRVIN